MAVERMQKNRKESASQREVLQFLKDVTDDLRNSDSLDEVCAIVDLRLRRLIAYDAIALFIRPIGVFSGRSG